MGSHIVPDPPCVLLVEADPRLRESLGKAFQAGGFVPMLAGDPGAALHNLAGASVPVLIILDLDSVREPGELLAHLRADARWSRVPVVVTGSSSDPSRHLQVDGVLPKPFDAERLVSLGRERMAGAR